MTRAQDEAAGTNWQAADTDGDGLTDGHKVVELTNPSLTVCDGDSMPGGEEIAEGLDLRKICSCGLYNPWTLLRLNTVMHGKLQQGTFVRYFIGLAVGCRSRRWVQTPSSTPFKPFVR